MHKQRDPKFFEIFRVDIVTGVSTLPQANDRFAYLFTDPQFEVRFGVRYTDDDGLEYLRRGADGDWELFTRIDVAYGLTA